MKRGSYIFINMKVTKEEYNEMLQLYEMLFNNDIEAQSLAIGLFLTSDFYKQTDWDKYGVETLSGKYWPLSRVFTSQYGFAAMGDTFIHIDQAICFILSVFKFKITHSFITLNTKTGNYEKEPVELY